MIIVMDHARSDADAVITPCSWRLGAVPTTVIMFIVRFTVCTLLCILLSLTVADASSNALGHIQQACCLHLCVALSHVTV